jgi:hypothetical protein
MSYKIITSDTNVSSYTENQNAMFTINVQPDEELRPNSVVATGKLRVLSNGNPLTGNEKLYIDPLSGIHSFIQMCTTKMNGSTVESLNEYARYAHMYFEATNDANSMANESKSQMELRNGFETLTSAMFLTGESDGALSFAFSPLCSANRTLQPLTNSNISLTFQFRNTSNSFYGSYNTPANDITYTIEDFKVMFIADPISPNATQKVQYVSIDGVKTTVNSPSLNLLLAPTGNLISISSSFIEQSFETNSIYNTLETQPVPNFKELEYFISGSQLKTKFPIKSLDECLLNYIQSVKCGSFVKSNCIYLPSSGVGFGTGLFLGVPINCSNGVRLNFKFITGIGNAYSMYTYYTRIEQL